MERPVPVVGCFGTHVIVVAVLAIVYIAGCMVARVGFLEDDLIRVFSAFKEVPSRLIYWAMAGVDRNVEEE